MRVQRAFPAAAAAARPPPAPGAAASSSGSGGSGGSGSRPPSARELARQQRVRQQAQEARLQLQEMVTRSRQPLRGPSWPAPVR